MDKQASLYITIKGRAGDEPLAPGNYDVREVQEMLAIAVDVLFGSEKRGRPLATYAIQEGSVKHVLTTLLGIVTIAGSQLEDAMHSHSLAQVDPVRARAIAAMQELAIKRKRIYSVGVSNRETSLTISDKTKFEIVESKNWAEAEIYLYGQIVDWGGTSKANIHLLTDSGPITIPTTIEYLSSIEQNMVYKTCCVVAIGKEDAFTGEIDYSSLKVKEIRPYSKSFYDNDYINNLGKKAKANWLGDLENPEAWLQQLRDHA